VIGRSAGWIPAAHNRVAPGDAVGVALRIPVERRETIVDLLEPHVSRELIEQQTGSITVYLTVGRDTIDGRPATHRWVNVIGDPPAGIPADEGLGGLACIGAPSNPITRMWWRHGLARVPGRLWVWESADHQHARVRITTDGGTLRAVATFGATGEPWQVRPQHYYALRSTGARLLHGDESGMDAEGSGTVTFTPVAGRTVVFPVSASLDLRVAWDYRLPAWKLPG
jgi:hypothetical protein